MRREAAQKGAREAGERREIESLAHSITSKRQAKSGRLAKRAMNDRDTFNGINHFLPARHDGESPVWLKGRSWVRQKPGRFVRDTMHDLIRSVD